MDRLYIGGHNIKNSVVFSLVFLFLGTALFAEERMTKQENAGFRDFPWGTSLEEFIAREGLPAARESINGLVSLAYENKEMSGYMTYMLVYFSESGLEGGTYYFLTEDLDELMACYRELQRSLAARYGPGLLMDEIIRERFPYESAWDISGVYIHLKANTRANDPVTLWYSSPALTKKLLGNS
jgi:hypothetical protein